MHLRHIAETNALVGSPHCGPKHNLREGSLDYEVYSARPAGVPGDRMIQLTKLREEHSHLLSLISRLTHIIGRNSPPPAAEFHALRHELASALIRHLKSEDWLLYPQLMGSSDPKVAQTAQALSMEMGDLANAFVDYAHRWGSFAIENDWTAYRRETADILGVLTQRITRENRELYPLLQSEQRAA